MSDQHDVIEKLPAHELNTIKHVIAVMSGKGGVGKSSVSALIAVEAARRGYKVGMLDADITGPSIPRMLGISRRPDSTEMGMIAPQTKSGIRVMSLNLLLEREDQPVIWRGPLMASAVRQFWTDVIWGDIDLMVVDLPPGTGDSPLTIMQSLPLEGVIIVSTPQPLAEMIVKKSINMARMMNVPVLGVVENMSYSVCPECGHKIHPFGESTGEAFARASGAPLLASLPLDPAFTAACNRGEVEDYHGDVSLDFAPIDALLSKKA